MDKKNPIYVKAIDKDTINILASKDFYLASNKEFRLYFDGKYIKKLISFNATESTSSNILTIKGADIDYQPGHNYEIATKDNYFFAIDFSYIAQTDEFENKFKYDGLLGAIYSKEKTTFRVFAPFATRVLLNIQKENGRMYVFPMRQNLENGVYSITLKGDFDRAKYTYSVTNFNVTSEVGDPYAFSSTSNGRQSYVIDPSKVYQIPTYRENLENIKDPTQAIIYELDVRDMTSKTNLPNKGGYQALSDTADTCENIGINYISSLGVNYVQILPTMDFQTVDEDNPNESYNWGYDPYSYFSPEGSYSSDPNDPYARIFELRKLIGSFHKRGIKVVQDVVYNHLYSTKFNMLSVLVPGYYLRKNLDGSLSNGSGCGNDFETRIYMARKLIIDSLIHYVRFFDVDGFRFDLMGIIDVDTLNKAKYALNKVKKGIILYGEGWDLWTALSSQEKASISNSSKLPDYGFFNDRFRDTVKGKSSDGDLNVCGYLLGNTNYIDGFKHVLLGSCKPIAFAPLFPYASQSVNYVECHDNHTLFDKISKACIDDTEEEMLRRIKLIDVAILTSCGIPFFHAGQEVGMSKNGCGNSYNAGDEINGFDYSLIKQRKQLVEFFKDAIKLRKYIETRAGKTFASLNSCMSFENLEYNALLVTFDLADVKIHIIYNPTKNSFMHTFSDYVKLIFNENGDVLKQDCFVKMAIINSLGCFAFVEKKGDDK